MRGTQPPESRRSEEPMRSLPREEACKRARWCCVGCGMGLGFLTLDSIDVVLGAGTDAWSNFVAIHSCVTIPHCVGISSCVSSSASRCILTHRKIHAWSENTSKNSKQHHQFSQIEAGRAQQLSVHALPHACRRSSGVVRVPTNNQVELRAVQSQAGEGLAGR